LETKLSPWLQDNQLTSVPAELGGITALLFLGLGGNQLTSVPAALGGLGLTLVHIFAQLEPFLPLKPAQHPTMWDRKCSR
jgi:Leucine-rich repeat (LRR) protein